MKLLVTQRGHHDGLDGVHTVFGLVEDDACGTFEDLFGNLDTVKSELLVDVASDLGLQGLCPKPSFTLLFRSRAR